MDKLIVKLKAIKYKIDIAHYLSYLPSSLAIEPSYQAQWFVSTSQVFLL